MTQVNTPYALPKLRPIGELSPSMNAYLTYLERLITQNYLRSGGPEDQIENALKASIFDTSSDAIERIEALEAQTPIFYPVKMIEMVTIEAGDTAFTTTGDQFITCLNTAAATITLNSEPEDGEDVYIWPTSAQITVSGPINGDSSLIIPLAYDAPHLKYSLAAEEWATV